MTIGRLPACLLLYLAATVSAAPVQFEQIEVELVTEVTSVQPGTPFWVGLRLAPEPGWKTYWRNPGSSGLPTAIAWHLPPPLSAGPIQWPYPERFRVQDIVSFGYTDEVLLLTEIRPATSLQPGDTVALGATASWLVCNDRCIPGEVTLSLRLPVSADPPARDLRWADTFTATRARLPTPAKQWPAEASLRNAALHLAVAPPQPVFTDTVAIEFFPGQRYLVADDAPQQTTWQPAQLTVTQPADVLLQTLPETLDGVIVVRGKEATTAYAIAASARAPATTDTAESNDARDAPHLIAVLTMALAGGLLLNLMPCVFPVLSLKAIALLEATNESDHSHHVHGIAYTLGIVSFFCVVAGLLYVLKAGGASVGWGFQLQAPWFVAALAYLLFVLGLSFSGFLEFGTRFMSVGESLTQRGGYRGSFFTGALAAIVASPCTAPFMGSAIAFAIVQPPLYSLLVFVALGIGMALPFLMLGYLPELGALLPRPGPWMETFKQLMAFPLYLTSIWLLWVLGRQTSATGMAVVLIGMVLIALAIWLRRAGSRAKGTQRTLNLTLVTVSGITAFGLLATPALKTATPPAGAGDAAEAGAFWQPYSTGHLAQLRAQGRPVFVNVTADWCISCLVNERVALRAPSVRRQMAEHRIAPLKGDWTTRDPEITAVLERFGRNGVPLYVLYPPDVGAEPLVLPQWLSPGTVIDAIATLTHQEDRS